MKRLAVVFTTILAFVALASFASCEGGTFIDPGHEAAYGFAGSGGGYDYGGDYGSKPSYLSDNASLDDAFDKLYEIIDYCESNSGNALVKQGAESLATTLNYFTDSTWSSQRSTMINSINGMIDSLQ
jgi:hypothetical protein